MNTVGVTADSKTIAMIELALVQESPDNPRQTYDQNALQELAKSIASEGIQVPLLIRGVEGEQRYELIAGHRRIRAAKIAGLSEVPCVLRQYTDEEARAARTSSERRACTTRSTKWPPTRFQSCEPIREPEWVRKWAILPHSRRTVETTQIGCPSNVPSHVRSEVSAGVVSR